MADSLSAAVSLSDLEQPVVRDLVWCVVTALALLSAAAAEAMPVEGVEPVNSRAYAPAVRRLIQQADSSIYLMLYQARYYEEYPETASNRFIDDLIAAARRGVDVNVLIDTGEWDPNQKNAYNLDYVDRLTGAGVKVWEDSPSEVSHQKVMTVDEDLTLIASLNWTYYSMAKNNEVAAVIRSAPLNAYFRRYFLEHAAAGRPRANAQPVTAAEAQQVSRPAAAEQRNREGQGRRKKGELPALDVEPIPDRLFYPAVHQALLNARRSVDVVQRSITLSPRAPETPEGHPPLPGEPAGAPDVFVEDLIAAARRGVKVRVILDKTENMNDGGNSEAAARLQAGGVQVFHEDPRAQTHAKLLIVDDKVILGSTNWTRPAIEQGNEASVVITSPEVAREYRRFVDGLARKGGPWKEEGASFWNDPADGP